jgi:hypothetical protein
MYPLKIQIFAASADSNKRIVRSFISFPAAPAAAFLRFRS